MVRVDDIETARSAEDEREVVGAGWRGDSGWERLGIRLWPIWNMLLWWRIRIGSSPMPSLRQRWCC